MAGNLHALQRLRLQTPPCQWDEETCQWAARRGHLDVLQWARQQQRPCPWNTSTVMFAAYGGHLVTLQWLLANYWDEKVCIACERRVAAALYRAAAAGGHMHVLQ